MPAHPADELIQKADGPVGIVRACKVCGFRDMVRKLPAGHAGRGWGMREGNRQRGRLIQHIRSEHPGAVEEIEVRWQREGSMRQRFRHDPMALSIEAEALARRTRDERLKREALKLRKIADRDPGSIEVLEAAQRVVTMIAEKGLTL